MKWAHLNGIPFPEIGKHPVVVILIGIDNADLHYSTQDVKGKPGEPMACLIPLGWTCIGIPDSSCKPVATHFASRYFILLQSIVGEVLRKFWEVEDIPGNPIATRDLKYEDKVAKEQVMKTMK